MSVILFLKNIYIYYKPKSQMQDSQIFVLKFVLFEIYKYYRNNIILNGTQDWLACWLLSLWFVFGLPCYYWFFESYFGEVRTPISKTRCWTTEVSFESQLGFLNHLWILWILVTLNVSCFVLFFLVFHVIIGLLNYFGCSIAFGQ